MADYVVKLSGQDNLTPTINNVKDALNGMSSTATGIEKIQEKFKKLESSTAPLQKKIKAIKNLMAELNLNGDANSPLYAQMAQAAGTYADAIADASAATSRFASDTLNLDVAVQGLQGVAAAGSIATGVMGLFGIENENVNNAILKVQSSLAILNGLQTVSNVLNKDSALILKLQALATTGSTITTSSFSAALTKNAIIETMATMKTKISTIAQTAWNVAKAIGMAMLGNFTGLALLAVGAVVGLTMATKSDTNATKESNENKEKLATTTEYLKEKSVEASNEINSSAGKLIASYKGLRTQFNSLGDDVEKAKWLEENKNKFNELGFAVDNVTDAEDFFNKSSGAVISALQKRAKAAALYDLYLKALQKQYELNSQSTVSYNWSYDGEKGGADYNKQKEQAYQAAVAKLNNDRKNQNAYVAKLEKDMLEAQTASDKAQSNLKRFAPKKTQQKRTTTSPKSGASNNTKVELNPANDNQTLKFAQDMVSQIEERLKNTPVTATVELNKAKEDLSKWQKEVEFRKLVITPEVDLNENSLEYAKDMFDKATKALNSIDLNLIDPKDLELALKQVSDWENEVKQREIKLGIQPYISDNSLAGLDKQISALQDKLNLLDVDSEPERFTELKKQIKELTEKKHHIEIMTSDLPKRTMFDEVSQGIKDVQENFRMGFLNKDEAIAQINELNAKLTELGLKPIDIDVNTDGLLDAQEKLEKFQESVGYVSEITGSLGSTVSSLGSIIDGAAGQWMGFAASAIESIGQVIPQIVALIGAKQAEAIASGTASGASLPFPANIAAIASIVATIAGIFASLPTFANGGVVGGSSMVGDHLLARVNSGEMILNGKQQDNLFKAIDGNRLGGNGLGGQVEFKIDGSVIKGVLNNHNSKMKKIR